MAEPAWLDRARAALPPAAAFVADRFVTARDGRTIAVRPPIVAGPLMALPDCGEPEVETAVAAARAGFASGRWSDLPPRERKRLLLRLADRIEADLERFALLETVETGRPLREARTVDVAGAVARLRWYAELADKSYGEVAPTGPGRLGVVTRAPVGVVVAIVPWNFPLLMAVTKVAPALAAGNAVILKPAETSSLTALALAEAWAALDPPPGILQVLTGTGRSCGGPLVRHPGVDAVAFTGSTATGRAILADAAATMKRVSLECGGKSPHVVLDAGAVDRAAAEAIAWGICYHQGQVCDAGANLIVVGDGEDRVIADVAAAMEGLTAGDPFDDTRDLGSMISADHLRKVDGFVTRAVAAGARVATGGGPADTGSPGAFYRPTVLARVDPAAEIFREEVFGPVLSVVCVPDVDAAVALVNGARYGLAAAVWGSDQRVAMAVGERLRAGTVAINTFELGDVTTPFGGFRQSGLGRDRSAHALANYTELKTTWIRTATP